MYQKGYQRWDLLRLNEYVGLWGIYSPKQGNTLYFFFKTLIQLYFLRLFLYSLTYCIKEVIKGKIFWRLNLKVPAYEVATAWNRGIHCNFSKHWSNCICFFISLFLTYCIKESIKDNIFGHSIWKCWPLRQLRPETGESLAKP